MSAETVKKMHERDSEELARELRTFFRAQAKTVWQYFSNPYKKTESKSPSELVGELDKILERDLGIFLPGLVNVPVIGEEGFFEAGGTWPPKEKSFWLVDPIDGTHNFLSKNPNFGSIVGLVENGKVVFGAVYLHSERRMRVPGEIYFAGKHCGAWKFSGRSKLLRLAVSAVDLLEKAVLLLEGPSSIVATDEKVKKAAANTLRFYKGLSSSVALAKIADGTDVTLPADILIMRGNKPWDSLAGALMAEEAGGIVTDFGGKPYSLENCSDLIFTNHKLHRKILALG